MPTTTIPWAGGVPYGDTANSVNQFMTNQAIQPFIANLPGYANMVGKRSENTQSMLSGQLPQDVQNQIAQRSAERGVGGGQVGSPNSQSALLRALGLTSLDMQNQGSQQLTQSIADTPIPELWNPASLFVPMTLGREQESAAVRGQQYAANTARAAQDALKPSGWGVPKSGTYSSQFGGLGSGGFLPF